VPYIEESERDRFAGVNTFGYACNKAGELDYVITRIIQGYMKKNGVSFATFAVIAGVLVLVLFEFVRRVVNDYEDMKIKDNGDVYEEKRQTDYRKDSAGVYYHNG